VDVEEEEERRREEQEHGHQEGMRGRMCSFIQKVF